MRNHLADGQNEVVAAVGVTFALVSSPAGSHAPRPLRLASGGSTDAALAPTVAGSGVASGDYRLTGTLPAGTPPDAPAWTLKAAASDDATAARLAKALHTAKVARSGAAWAWSSCGVDTAVSSDGVTSGCAVSAPGIAVDSGGGSAGSAPSAVAGSAGSGNTGSGSSPTCTGPQSCGVAAAPPQPGPEPTTPVPTSTVKAAAAPVFEALGLDLGKATIDTSPYGGSATLAATVDGLDAVGQETRVSVDGSGALQSANGWLGDPVRGDSYPLLSAQQAFDALPSVPRMMLACPVGPDGKGCLQPQPAEITGAHLGLELQQTTDSGQVLVPAWLFAVTGASQPLAQVAVEPKYLGSAEPTNPPANTASDQPVPAPPQVDPVTPPTTVSISVLHHSKNPNEVIIEYGDSGSCPHTHVTHQVKEDSAAVYVYLQADPQKPGVACTDDYRAVLVTVELQAPLGNRKVYDASHNSDQPLTYAP